MTRRRVSINPTFDCCVNRARPRRVGSESVDLVRQPSQSGGMAGWASHAAGAVPGTRLVVFPGEGTNAIGATVGHIYVMVGGVLKQTYPVAGGPPPGHGRTGEEGGHSAGATPPGLYVLGYKEHHTTQNWPSSVVPFGAVLRETKGSSSTSLPGCGNKHPGPGERSRSHGCAGINARTFHVPSTAPIERPTRCSSSGAG